MLKANIKDDFSNLLEYHQWVNHTIRHISSLNKEMVKRFSKDYIDKHINYDKEWYGAGVTYEELSSGVTTYKDPELIERLLNQVSDRISTQTKDKIKARKVKFNPNGLGVFVFDRAAMGMYRLKEFYSPSKNTVVDPQSVKQSGKNFTHKLDGTPVVERWEEKADGKPKIRTSSKNVYAYFPKVSKEKQAVELFISCGAHSGIKANELLYSGIGAIIVAELLEKARIQTKISVVFGSSPDGYSKTAYACLVPIKQYNEPLDKNLLALLSSDPRFFRYEGFKGIVSIYDYFRKQTPETLGKGMTKDTLQEVFEESDYSTKAKLAHNRFYFGWTFNESDVIKQINETIDELANRLLQG
jgi:hypothetical protein